MAEEAMKESLEEAGVFEPEKKRKLGVDIDNLINAVAVRVSEKSDASWEARLPNILKEVDKKMDEKVKASEDKTMKVTESIRSEIADLKKSAFSDGRSTLMGRTTASAYGSASGGGTSSMAMRAGPFVPTKVEVKGFIADWARRDEDSLTKPEMMSWVALMCAEMPEDVRKLINVEAIERYSTRVLYTKIELKLEKDCTREDAWRVKKQLDQMWAEGKGFIKKVKPYATVEASPEKRPYFQQGGRFFGIMEKKGVPKSSLKPEWGPPLRIFDVASGPRPIAIAEYEVTRGWAIYEGPVQKLVEGLSAEDLMALLK